MAALTGFSQENRMIDSLKRELKTQKTEEDKASLLALLATRYLESDDSANTMSYARAAFLLYARQKNAHGMANASRLIANLYLYKGQWQLADVKFREALVFLNNDTTRKSKVLEGIILINYAFMEESRGMKKRCLQLLFEAAIVQEKYQDYKNLAITYRNIGIQFEYSGDQGRAGNYYGKFLEAAIQTKDEAMIFDAYLENARFMINRQKFSRAEEYLERAKSTCQLSASDPLWGQYFSLKANTYIHKKEYDRALDCFNQAQALIDPTDRLEDINILMGRVEVYKAQKNYVRALKDARDVYAIASHDTINIDISSRTAILMTLIEMEEKNGNYAKAYSYLQEKLALDRRVNMQEMPLKLRELDVKYQTAKKDKDLLILQNNNKQQEIRIQKNRILNVGLVSGICILVLITALLFILFYNRRKLTEKKEIIYEQQIEGLKKEQELINYAAILEGQEQERSRLARDLHDGLNGVLSGIVMQLSALSNSSDEKEEASHLKRIIGRMNEAVTEVRNIAHNLMPTHLAKLGLDNGLRDLCNTLRSEQTDVIYRSYDLSAAIPQRKQITIYRMIQELVMNAVKHAGAKNILVECLQDGETLNITVEDDGRGFDAELPEDRDGIGMENIKKRVGFLKGSINIRSLIGTGTTIHIQCLIHD